MNTMATNGLPKNIADGAKMKWYLDPTTGKMYYVAQNSEEALLYAQALRKRKIRETLDALHEMQMEMIDVATEKSDMKEAKEVIAHIQSLPKKPLTK
jgi:hypothetical protein